MLHFLPVTWRFLQRADDERTCRRYDLDLRLSILNDQLHGDLQAFPVTGRLGDVVTNLLGRLHTKESKFDIFVPDGSGQYY